MSNQKRHEHFPCDAPLMAFFAECGTATVKYYMYGGGYQWTLRGLFREHSGRILPGYEKLVTLDDNYDVPEDVNWKAEADFAKKSLLECYPDAKITDVIEFYEDNTYIELIPDDEDGDIEWDENLAPWEHCPFIEPL